MPPSSSASSRLMERAAAPASATDGLAAATLPGLLMANARSHPRRVAMREKDLGIWQEYTWESYARHVTEMAAGLAALGFREGEVLLIMGDNRPRIYFGMLAAELLRGIPCPIYPDAIPDEVAYVAREVQARFALAEDQEQVDKFLALSRSANPLERILYDDPRGLARYEEPGLVSCDELQRQGRSYLQGHPGFAERQAEAVTPHDVAVLLYSSGTTGHPKGVPLRHRHVLAAVRNALQARYFGPEEEVVAYLPVAWVGDFIFSVAAALALRFTVNIPERQETVLRDLREIGPTLYFAPPRSWDHMLTHIQVRMQESSRLKRWLFDTFMPLAVRAERESLKARRPRGGTRPRAGGSVRPWQRLVRAAGEFLVYGPIKDHLGLSRVRHAYTAGEAIGEETFLFFRALGVNLKQFYGQTENSALTAAQANHEVKLRSVGRPLPGVQLRVAPSGEILLRADSLFDGYFRKEEATARAFEEGWFRTGDAGYFDDDGHLVILGRAEEVATTASGERFVPQYVENQLKFSPFVKEAAVLGGGRAYLAAMVCIDLEAVGHWAELRGIPYTSYADLSQKPEVYELVAGVIRGVNAELPEGLRIRRFVNLHKEFDPDDGELTRTRKLRRRVIEERYREVIDALYGERSEVAVAATVVYEDGRVGVIQRVLRVAEVEASHALSR